MRLKNNKGGFQLSKSASFVIPDLIRNPVYIHCLNSTPRRNCRVGMAYRVASAFFKKDFNGRIQHNIPILVQKIDTSHDYIQLKICQWFILRVILFSK